MLTLQLLGLQIAASAVLGIPAGIYDGISSTLSGGPVVLPSALGQLSVIVGSLFAVGFLLRREFRRARATWRTMLRPTGRIVPLLTPFVICIVGAMIVRSELGNLLRTLVPPPSWLVRSMENLGDLAVHPFTAPLILIVIAPVTEELFFRGFLLRGLLAVTTAPRAILISTLLFTAIHLNPWQFPTAFSLGALVGWIYLRTRSIGLCIAGHAFNNAIALLAPGLPLIVAGFNSVDESAKSILQPWWFDTGGVVALTFGLWLLHRRSPPPEETAPGILSNLSTAT